MINTEPNQQTSLPPPRVREVPGVSPLRWLSLGWRDLMSAGTPSLLHGIIVSLISILIIAITVLHWELLPGAVSGFVLTGPFLATGLYAISRRLEQGNKVSLRDALDAWINASRCLFNFGILLLLSATAWVIFSVLMFHFFIETSIEKPMDFLRYVVTQNDVNFMLWTILGALGAALAFAVTVVSLPLLVERDVTTRIAIHTSVQAVGTNPFTMLWWAMTIMIITGISFLTGMLGFILLYPLLGHASWHAYRDLVDASQHPLRGQTDPQG